MERIRQHYWRDFAMLFIGALMFSLSFAPFRTGFTAWFALIPLWSVLEDKPLGRTLLYGYFYGFVLAFLGLWWIVFPSIAGMIGAVLFLAIYWALYAGLLWIAFKHSRTLGLISAPIMLILMEFIRGWGRLGFPWQDLAYTQTYYHTLIQFADITGHLGVSLWVALLNLFFYLALERIRWHSLLYFLFAAILIGGAYIYGTKSIQNIPPCDEDEDIKIALLQGDIDPYIKWDKAFVHKNMDIYLAMIDSAAHQKPDLIVMPETATAGYWRSRKVGFNRITRRAWGYKIPILTGTLDYEATDRTRYYNAAYFASPDGKDEIYRKMQLVPVSEQMPFQEEIPFLRKLDLGGSHFTRGDSALVFDMGKASFGVTICYESLFPSIVRRERLNGADFLLNITNDGWFKKTQGPYQHFRFNIFRAIENRIPIARCANTGISAFIDRAGRVRSSMGLWRRGILYGNIAIRRNAPLTFYTRYGDIIGWFSVSYLPIVFLLGIFRGGAV